MYIPSIINMKITLGNAPTDAGLYVINVVSTDFNYLPTVGIGALTILPISRNIKLSFKDNVILTKTTLNTLLLKIPVGTAYEVSYENFRSARFDEVCGAKLTYNGVEVKDAQFLVTYTGLADDLDPNLDIFGKPTKSGTYMQTISVVGNYQTLPITRTIRVAPAEVVIEAESEQGFAYDGMPHAVAYKAYFREQTEHLVPTEDMSVNYKQKSTGILGGLIGLVTRGSTTAPSAAGTYEVTISYIGDSATKKTVTLTIEAAEQEQSTAKTTKSSGLFKLFR